MRSSGSPAHRSSTGGTRRRRQRHDHDRRDPRAERPLPAGAGGPDGMDQAAQPALDLVDPGRHGRRYRRDRGRCGPEHPERLRGRDQQRASRRGPRPAADGYARRTGHDQRIHLGNNPGHAGRHPAAPPGPGGEGSGVRGRDPLVGEAASFIAFFAVGATLRRGVAAPTLGQPGVLRAVAVTGAGFCLTGLLGLGLGAIIRHSAPAVGVLVAGVYVVAQFIGFIAHSVASYMPILIVENSLSTTKPVTCGTDGASCPHFLSAWAGLGVMSLYAAIALAVGGWLLARRDA